MRKMWPLMASVTIVTMLAGCTPSAEKTEPSPSVSSSPDFSGLTPYPPGNIDEDSGEVYNPVPPAVWDDTSRAAVVKAGEAAMAAFARPTLDHDTWWSELSPLLNSRAREDYAYVQPESIPANKVTGSGKLTDDTSALAATVSVPTDVGVYEVILNRADGEAVWEVARFTPPEGVR